MFRRHALVLCCLSAIVLAVGCDSGTPTHETVTKDTVSAMEEMVTVLKTVKDEPSADAAKPQLQAIGERMKKLKEQNEKLGEPSADKKAAIKKEYEARMQKVMGELLGETMRVGMDPKLNGALKDVKMGGAK